MLAQEALIASQAHVHYRYRYHYQYRYRYHYQYRYRYHYQYRYRYRYRYRYHYQYRYRYHYQYSYRYRYHYSLFQAPRWWWKVVESRSVIRNARNARGLGRDRAADFSRRHRPLFRVVRVLFSLYSF